MNGDFYPTEPDETNGATCFDMAFASIATVLVILVILISGLFYFAAAITPEVIVPAGDCLNHLCM